MLPSFNALKWVFNFLESSQNFNEKHLIRATFVRSPRTEMSARRGLSLRSPSDDKSDTFADIFIIKLYLANLWDLILILLLADFFYRKTMKSIYWISGLVTSLLGIDARVAFVITVLQREKVVGIAPTSTVNESLACFRLSVKKVTMERLLAGTRYRWAQTTRERQRLCKKWRIMISICGPRKPARRPARKKFSGLLWGIFIDRMKVSGKMHRKFRF